MQILNGRPLRHSTPHGHPAEWQENGKVRVSFLFFRTNRHNTIKAINASSALEILRMSWRIALFQGCRVR